MTQPLPLSPTPTTTPTTTLPPLPPLPLPPVDERRVARRRWAVRILAGICIALAIGYAALPLWLPTDLLRRRLEADLTSQLGSPVRIGQLQASWYKGISLNDLTIADDRPGKSGQVLHIGRIGCELSPIKLLAGKKLRKIEITDPHIWLEIDEAGLINIGDLGGSGRDGKLPSLNYSVSGLVFHVITPQVMQTFRLDRINLQLDPKTGLLHLTSITRVNRTASLGGTPLQGRLDFNATVRVPRLKKTEQLNGEIHVDWADLALNDLPVPIISRVPVEQVDGTSSGHLAFKTHPDLGVDFDLSILLNGVRIMRPELHRPAQVPDADLSCAGHWDPNVNSVEIKKLRYETRALKIEPASADRPVLHYDQNGQTPLQVHLKGLVKNWDELQREIPEVNQLAQAVQSDPAGQASFVVDFVRTTGQDRMGVEFDATASSWNFGPGGNEYLRALAGLAKTCRAELIHDRRANRLSMRKLSLTLDDLNIDATGEFDTASSSTTSADRPLSPLLRLMPHTNEAIAQALAMLPTTRAEIVFKSPDAARLRRLLPCLNRTTALQRLAGPLQCVVGIEPDGTTSRIRVSATLAAESSLAYADLIDKQPGRQLQVRTEATLPATDSGRISLASAEIQYGQGRAELATDKTGFEYRLEFEPDKPSQRKDQSNVIEEPCGAKPSARSIKATWNFGLHLTALQDLLALSPRLKQMQVQHEVTQLVGDCELDCRSQLSHSPGVTTVHSQVRLLADDLAVRWSDNLNKIAGSPLDIDVRHSWQRLADWQEHQVAADVRRRSGAVNGKVVFAVPRANETASPIQITAGANLTDIGDWLELSPRIHHELGTNKPTGEASVSVRATYQQGKHSGRLTIDATQACFGTGNQDGWTKPTGLPATADITWHADTPAGGSGEQHLAVDQAHLQLGDSTIDRINADISLEPPSTQPPDLLALFQTLHGKMIASGKLVISDELKSVHPLVRQWIDELELDGTTAWQINSQLGPALASIDCRIDASDATVTLGPYGDVVQRIVKPIGDAVSASASVTINNWLTPGPHELTVRQAAVNLLDATLTAQGRLRLSDFASSPEINISLRVPQTQQLLHMMPNPPVQTLRGGIEADVSLIAGGQSPNVSQGRLAFDNLQFGSAKLPLILQGGASLDRHTLQVEGLDWRWGRSAGTISGTIKQRTGGYAVQLGVFGEYIHVEDMFACIADLRSGLPLIATSTNTASTQTSGRDQARKIIDIIRRSQANIETRVGTVVTPLPLNIKAVLDAAWQKLTLEGGKMAMKFACMVDGGQVDGDVTIDLNTAEPMYRLTYTAERIQAGNVADAYLRRTFPGMVASGPLTLIDESNAKLLPAPGEPNYELGKGQIIIDGGIITGRAAPLWVTRVFPGLNLASFDFTRMHSWFEKTAVGRTNHQMLYRGTYYHVYMLGWSELDGTFRYEVGVDFLAGLESEYWANTGQGRVPLFTKTGQVMPDGTLHDETVTYVSLQRVLETLFVNNNPLVTAYYGVMKRVEGKP